MLNQWVSRKWVIIGLHFLFWILFFVSPLLRPVMERGYIPMAPGMLKSFIALLFFNNFIRLIFFYVNAYILVPELAYKKRYLEYALVIIGIFLLSMVFDKFIFELLIDRGSHSIWNFFVFNIFPYSFVFVASTAYKMIMDKMKEESILKERETEQLKTELSFLRSQVSPHFMFNVLNNMVALARKKSDALEPSLIKLSSLLRYMLYETGEDKVPLEKELQYLQSYIDLQQQRFGKKIEIITDLQLPSVQVYYIEPMLLIPFVENAFKHGSGMMEDARIEISLRVHAGILEFIVKNRYQEYSMETKDKTSGIGLNNVRRRLDLLYPKQHSLHINESDGWFTILLTLNLHG